jgi:AmmeMemoRadiSam system protein B/AmmeMemoRadiSam system protein A
MAILVIAFVVVTIGMYYAYSGDGAGGGVDKSANPVPADREVVALVVPHAGYAYSAHVAAYGYAVLKRTGAEVVFLLGSPHFYRLDGASVYDGAAYETPLGKALIDRETASVVRESSERIRFEENAHSPEKTGRNPEHSLEAQIPFIQTVLPNARIVPILYRATGEKDDSEIAGALMKAMTGRKAVLVISSDMVHYPAYEAAKKADEKTLEAMKKLDPSALRKNEKEQRAAGVPDLGCALCGIDAVAAGFIAAKKLGADKVQVLKYANSGDVPIGDKSGVVGYGAVALTRKKGSAPEGEAVKPKSVEKSERVRKPGRAGVWYPGDAQALKKEIDGYLANAEKALGYGEKEAGVMDKAAAKELLSLARKTLEAALVEKPVPKHEPVSEIAKEKLGCFVTLTVKKTGALRGCIGLFTDDAEEPLYKNIQKYAVYSALKDSRFAPVTREELDGLHIEISVLSKNEPIEKPLDLVPYRHGIVIAKGWRRGVYLPQVFEHFKKRHPDKSDEELTRLFLSSCASEKAGLSPDAWEKDPEVKVYVFTATIIEEED